MSKSRHALLCPFCRPDVTKHSRSVPLVLFSYAGRIARFASAPNRNPAVGADPRCKRERQAVPQRFRALTREMRATLQQIAQELGQWGEEHELTGKEGEPLQNKADLSMLSDEELGPLRASSASVPTPQVCRRERAQIP